MSNSNSNIIIKDNQVQFSKEVLEYFESIKTEENKEWIEKYFKILSDPSNIIAEKFNKHHIRPCFTFKDTKHKNRRETQKLADSFSENKIKLSIYNHLLAHFYLWKIFENRDSKIAFQHMCDIRKHIDTLTELEIKTIALLKEKCAKKNLTKQEKREWQKRYDKTHNEERKEYKKKWYETHKENTKEYRKFHKEQKKEYNKKWCEIHTTYMKEYYKIHKEYKKEYHKKLNNQMCYDPIKEDYVLYNTLNTRKKRNKDLYKNIILRNYIIQN